MTTNEASAPHVYRAVNEVMTIMASEGIAKGRRNQQQGFDFRGIDDIYAVLCRVLSNAKLCMFPRVTDRSYFERATKSGGMATFTTLTIDFDFVSAIDGSKHTVTTVGEAQDSADKSSNKSMSAAMKYACLMTFMIPTEGDNDSDFHHDEKQPPPEPPSLEKQLAASVDWAAWTKRQESSLRNAKTLGALNEAWGVVYAERERTPNGTQKRLGAVKDEVKARLSAPAEQRP